MSGLADRVEALQRAARIIDRRPGRFVLGMLLCAAALSLPLFLLALLSEAAPAWRSLNSGPEIAVFLKIGSPERELDGLRSRLTATDGVVGVRIIPREEAYADLRKRLGLQVSPDDLRSNPLPDALVARFAMTVEPATVERAAAAVRNWPSVDTVQADLDWFRRLVVLNRAARVTALTVGALATALVVIGLAVGILAAVRLRRDEAELLWLVGAEPSFMGRPYAYVGALSAAGGAILAVAVVALGYTAVEPQWIAAAQLLGLPRARLQVPLGLALGFIVVAGVLGRVVGGLSARRQLRDLFQI